MAALHQRGCDPGRSRDSYTDDGADHPYSASHTQDVDGECESDYEPYSDCSDDEHQHQHQQHHDQDDNDESDNDGMPPRHPVPVLQEAFEESIVEAAEDVQYETTPTIATHPSAEARRQEILEQETYNESWNARWNQDPSARWHPLTKLIAQIIFGMHLLHNHQAKSDVEVVKILQAHVDDIDGFLEKSTEDFDLAIQDIEERMAFLRLPMVHLDVFDIMLEDKTFRTQLMDGNVKIEKIIERTVKAMNGAFFDVDNGISATEELAKYLDMAAPDWPEDHAELGAIFTAMRGNQEGWFSCLEDLQSKGSKLEVVLGQLGATISEMSRLAAAASRRSKHVSIPAPRSKYASGGPNSHPSRKSRHSTQLSHRSLDKPLPQEPEDIQHSVQATSLNVRQERHPSMDDNHDRQHQSLSHRYSSAPSQMQPRAAQASCAAGTDALAAFIKDSGPTNYSPFSTVASPVTKTVTDSAYSSGTDPAVERRNQKRLNAPARLGLFPDSKPPTPDSFSRPTSAVPKTSAPFNTSSQVRPSPSPSKSGHFSIKRMFHRKSRIQEVI